MKSKQRPFGGPRFPIAAMLAIALAFMSQLPARAALPAFAIGEELPSLAPMLEGVQRAVVNINTKGYVSTEQNPMFQDPFFRRFFDLPDSQPERREAQSLGSGVIIDAEKGYVVTNAHVIENAEEINVTLQDGHTLDAKLIGTDRESDVAVVQMNMDGEDIDAIALGDSDDLRVGDFVVAIGNPFGLSQTVTSGIVSALGRSGLGIENYENFIQTDASINPGNSGGALVNLRGELIGINTAILSRSGGNVGIGFAIPVNMVRGLVDQLLEYGEVRRGKLGVFIQDLTPELADALNATVDRGALISAVVENSPAERAGIRDGDVIIEVNGKDIQSASDLRNAVGLLRTGSRVEVKYVRDGREQFTEATIESTEELQIASKPSANDAQTHISRLAGARFRNIEESEVTDGTRGVLVVAVDADSAAEQSGLVEGDIIVSINQETVENIAEMRKAIEVSAERLLVQIKRGEGTLYLVFQ